MMEESYQNYVFCFDYNLQDNVEFNNEVVEVITKTLHVKVSAEII